LGLLGPTWAYLGLADVFGTRQDATWIGR